MTKEALQTVLAAHALWLANKGGARANLRGADLCGANLCDADLRGANLCDAKSIPEIAAARLMACPESGAFEGWKKCSGGVLVRLLVPATARRSSATTRKCRAEFAKVLEVVGARVGISIHDSKTEYRKGKTVKCDKWEANRRIECGGGIHFFLTRVEAENY